MFLFYFIIFVVFCFIPIPFQIIILIVDALYTGPGISSIAIILAIILRRIIKKEHSC